MSNNNPKEIFLKDYQAPAFDILSVHLEFDLKEEATRVTNRMQIRRAGDGAGDLWLDGEELELERVSVDGRVLQAGEYQLNAEGLAIPGLSQEAELEIVSLCNPKANTKLDGLYLSNGKFCTQCEAEGFRRITFYPDRPDVMSRFDVVLRADKAAYPLLLSNGNLIAEADLGDGRHMAHWQDPFAKPAYLFALVAGDLGHLQDHYTTGSGKRVELNIYCDKGNEEGCRYAMGALQRSMKWDEERYGLEYDLEIYNIVAVADFNMGAMENKSLNVFNSKFILATPDTATDVDYGKVEGIVAHEYFHNWTGNRVTCRDWFQLSLKEGLTVFRDQQFTADMRSAAVRRIEDVRTLRAGQFPEDAGPLAHPVRPESYMEINNFYTATVYDKGAELIRMMHTLLGEEKFRKGMDLYFERHDGQAVTCNDFAAAMADASGIDLEHFKLWYSQAGTPTVTSRGEFDQAEGRFSLTLSQETRPTPGQPEKLPLHIPLALGLLDENGNDIGEEQILELREEVQTFHFDGLSSRPVVSLNRGFSAPVNLKSEDENPDNLAFLMTHDSDAFNRWEAGQKFATDLMLEMIADYRAGREFNISGKFIEAYGSFLADSHADRAFTALAMTLPGESMLAQAMTVVDVDAIHAVREALLQALCGAHADRLTQIYEANRSTDPYSPDSGSAGRRSLKNAALGLLAAAGDGPAIDRVYGQYQASDNMTDRMAALSLLNDLDDPRRQAALDDFYDRYKDNTIVVDKWLMLQATSSLPDTLENIQGLLVHPSFTMRQPNKVRSLIGAFAAGNQLRFHGADGGGYDFLADQVMVLDDLNPQVGARILAPLGRWHRFDAGRQEKMKAALQRLLAKEGLSRNIYEIAAKSLG